MAEETPEIQVKIIKKKIRSIRLKITPQGEVICTASIFASDSKIEEFIKSKKAWILKTRERVMNAAQNQTVLRKDGVAVQLGFTEEDRVQKGKNFVYSARWKKAAMENFEHTVCTFLPCFEAGLLPQFDLKARSMHSMWGNCNVRKKSVTLNWELLNFPQCCIDYVVLHEMTHFLYINHDRKFYGYIEKYMPQYKQYVKMMK